MMLTGMDPLRHGQPMNIEPGTLGHVHREGGRRTAVDVFERLQEAILSGRIAPGTILSQVEVARELGVSRTPVREALRKLHEGGLISDEPNLRSRVLGFDPADIEALYMKRIMMEALGVVITTRRLSASLRGDIGAVARDLESDAAHNDFGLWKDLHRKLHGLLVSESGDPYVSEIAVLGKRSERYQSVHRGQHLPGWWLRGEQEHRDLLEAVFAGDSARAGELMARHLVRTALELLAALAPDYDAFRLRASLRFASAGVLAAGPG